jgi:hypothetical protein
MVQLSDNCKGGKISRKAFFISKIIQYTRCNMCYYMLLFIHGRNQTRERLK